MRIGIGYDVHQLVEGRKLILGGVEIPYERGLDGHSDADVLAHAVADAVLGAVRAEGAGDIGQLFPDTDPAYKDANSIELLHGVAELAYDHGYRVVDLDCDICCEEPKLSPYRDAMRERLAAALIVSVDHVGVKATTTEGLGYEGRGEGISARAVCLLEEL